MDEQMSDLGKIAVALLPKQSVMIVGHLILEILLIEGRSTCVSVLYVVF